jgi:hypothetical protein
MSFKLLLGLFALTALVNGFQLPKGQVDGVYHVTMDANGNENHTLIGEIPSVNKMSEPLGLSPKFSKRGTIGDTYTSCGSATITGLDYASATQALINRMIPTIQVSGGAAIYAVSGDAWAFCCVNDNSGTNWCDAGEYQQALRIIGKECPHNGISYAAGECC